MAGCKLCWLADHSTCINVRDTEVSTVFYSFNYNSSWQHNFCQRGLDGVGLLSAVCLCCCSSPLLYAHIMILTCFGVKYFVFFYYTASVLCKYIELEIVFPYIYTNSCLIVNIFNFMRNLHLFISFIKLSKVTFLKKIQHWILNLCFLAKQIDATSHGSSYQKNLTILAQSVLCWYHAFKVNTVWTQFYKLFMITCWRCTGISRTFFQYSVQLLIS